MEANTIQKEEVLKKISLLPEAQLVQVAALLTKMEEEQEKKEQMYRQAIEELCGKYRDVLPSSEDFIRKKKEEKELDL